MNEKFTRLWDTKNKDDEWWSSFVTAPIAILLTYAVIDIKWLTPNLITLVSFVTAILSALFIIAGGSTNFLIAALLIHLSHVFDCMDGQIARFRKTSTASGSYFDRVTDQMQVAVWFAAVGYAAFLQSGEILPVFLALIGVVFYAQRGYAKYVAIHVEASRDQEYLAKMAKQAQANQKPIVAGLGYGLLPNLFWFFAEQRKILHFDEGVFIFMLSLSLVLDQLTPMLWLFAASQLYYGLFRSWQHGQIIEQNQHARIKK